jgi:hypothetical protein
MSQKSTKPNSIVNHYMKKIGLATKSNVEEGGAGFESPQPRVVDSLTDKGIQDSVEQVRAQLERFAKKYYADRKPEQNTAEINLLCDNVRTGLKVLKGGNEEELKNNAEAISGLESIILGDGTRPLYLIRDNTVDFDSTTSLVKRVGNTEWESSILRAYQEGLKSIIPSVGVLRSASSDNLGTGFLVAPDLLMTNRHVWKKLGEHAGGYQQIVVDFQYEMGSQTNNLHRRLDSLVFLGQGRRVQGGIVSGTDVAVFSLSTGDRFGQTPIRIQSGRWDASSDDVDIFVIGHPLIPDTNEYLRFLSGTSGVKRLSPGLCLRNRIGEPVYHTASTLKGCSGGLIVSPMAPKPTIALALHFGDTPVQGQYLESVFAELINDASRDGVNVKDGEYLNTAHALPDILDEVSENRETVENGTLREILQNYGALFEESTF